VVIQTSDEQTDEAILVDGVIKTFGSGTSAVHALDDVSVTIHQNEFFTLLGPSGCGKTTLLRLIAGFDHPSAGTILLQGQDISHLPPNQRSVNTVFQSYALFPHMTVAQNISFGLEMLGRPKAEVSETVDAMLSLVRMEELKHRRTDEISGGQAQRVALARALAPRPKVLLLDEPLSALDYKLRKDMQIELKRLQHETGITFIFVTHDQEEALTMSDRVAVMNHGKVLQIGSPREIYDHPADRFVADFIGDTNFLDADFSFASEGRLLLRFAFGAEIETGSVDGVDASSRVTAAIRPEHAKLAPADDQATFVGTLENIVYMGTDTHYHIKLGDGSPFVVRSQNLRDLGEPYRTGQSVGISLMPSSVQVLKN